MILPRVGPTLREKMYNPIHHPRSWRKRRPEFMAQPTPSVAEPANAQRIRAASRLPKLVAFADQIKLAKNMHAEARKVGRFPKYSAVGVQKKFYLVNTKAAEILYSSTKHQNTKSIESLRRCMKVLPKFLYQKRNGHAETANCPICQTGVYNNRQKGKSLLPGWPIQWVIDVVRWLGD